MPENHPSPEAQIAAAAPGADEVRHLNVRLNPQGVIAPALRAMKQTSEIVAISLNALENADLDSVPRVSGAFFHVEVRGEIVDAATRRSAYASWVVSKGFQDIAKGVRESLEEAFLYIKIIETLPGRATSADLQRITSGLRKRANRMNFPDLLRHVGEGLNAPLHFEDEFRSLQKTRNCLEHRDGLVTVADVDQGADVLRLILPRLTFLIERQEQEIELQPNMRLEAGETIQIRRDRRERNYRIGERVGFVAGEFHEIALACFFFANDLAEKLPRTVPGRPSQARKID